MKKIKKSTIVTGVFVLLILLFAGLSLKAFLERNQLVEAAEGTRTSTAVRITAVTVDTIENTVLINGDVQAINQVTIFPTVAGKITETFFQVGDRVSQGTVVAMVDPSRPGQVFSTSPVVSTIAGTIVQAPINRGDTVSTQTPIYVVGDLSNLMVETFVPERFSNAARLGLSAKVTLEAFPGETFTAVVEELSPVIDPSSRTLRIRLRFEGRTDPRIKSGMFTTVSLVTGARENVPVVPRATVISSFGKWYVFTVDDQNIARRKEINMGLENEEFIEVLEGLKAGDMIISQ